MNVVDRRAPGGDRRGAELLAIDDRVEFVSLVSSRGKGDPVLNPEGVMGRHAAASTANETPLTAWVPFEYRLLRSWTSTACSRGV
jgi:hypothetical protein